MCDYEQDYDYEKGIRVRTGARGARWCRIIGYSARRIYPAKQAEAWVHILNQFPSTDQLLGRGKEAPLA